MVEQQCSELALPFAVDQISLRICASGFPAPASYAELIGLSSPAEAEDWPGADEVGPPPDHSAARPA